MLVSLFVVQLGLWEFVPLHACHLHTPFEASTPYRLLGQPHTHCGQQGIAVWVLYLPYSTVAETSQWFSTAL